MTELEIAIEYGVPTSQTCKELNWKEKTLFYWLYCRDEGGLILCNVNQIENLTKNGVDFEEIASAPQMHEILSLFPVFIDEEKYHFFFHFDKIGYKSKFDHIIEIKNNHYAEALAKLWLTF
jgi:hypothetical protein